MPAGGWVVANPQLAMAAVAPPMGGVGGSGVNVCARVAALEARRGAVVSRTCPPIARTTAVEADTQTGTVAVEAATQTDDTVLWSCYACSQAAGGCSKE